MTQPLAEPDIYHRRRQDLIRFMRGGIAIISTAPQQYRNGDVRFPFRPDSDFYYLTHFPEPEAVAVIIPDRPEGEYLLFCRPRDTAKEIWDGRRYGPEGAVEKYAADQAFCIDRLHEMLPRLMQNHNKVYASIGCHPDFDNELIQSINELKSKQRTGVRAPAELIDLGHILHEMRLIKRKEEQRCMRQAARLSAAAHRRAMCTTAAGKFEYQVQAELECEFRLGGSASPAYPSIVAGGKNACILHYTENCDRLNDGDLLLIDAGAELDCYAADITRTFPVNGKFTAPQQAVYEVVLAAQKAAIEVVVKDQPLEAYHNRAVEVITDGLIELGLLHGERNELIETRGYESLYMHRTGHWLGMDVHDVGDYKINSQWRLLEPGMVLTVEPGVYIAPCADIDPKWHHIGIRIEDDILVTGNGNENLSIDAPKEIADIEALMAG